MAMKATKVIKVVTHVKASKRKLTDEEIVRIGCKKHSRLFPGVKSKSFERKLKRYKKEIAEGTLKA